MLLVVRVGSVLSDVSPKLKSRTREAPVLERQAWYFLLGSATNRQVAISQSLNPGTPPVLDTFFGPEGSVRA